MIKKKFILILFLSVICISSLLYFIPKTDDKKHLIADAYDIETFKYNNGWGYQINKDGKVIIYQPYMPCIEGEKPFPNEKSALKVGEFVLSKIKNNENFSITMEELTEKIRTY